VIPNFFSPTECREWIDVLEDDSTNRWDYTHQRATRYMAHRECFRQAPPQAHATAAQLFRRLRQTCPDALRLIPDNSSCCCGCNPNVRLYKYGPGMSFGPHIDESNTVQIQLTTEDAATTSAAEDIMTETTRTVTATTRYTMLLYLSACQGGATRFELPPNSTTTTRNTTRKTAKNADQDVAFAPQVGALLLHLHGDDCLTHQADPVRGTEAKYVLRTDLVEMA